MCVCAFVCICLYAHCGCLFSSVCTMCVFVHGLCVCVCVCSDIVYVYLALCAGSLCVCAFMCVSVPHT